MSAGTMQRKKVAVIGAAPVGACCAAALQREGYDVTIFDPDGFGRGCAEGTVGIFATNIVAPASSEAGVQAMLAAARTEAAETMVVNRGFLPDFLPWFASFVASAGPKSFEAGKLALKQAQALAIPTLLDVMGRAAFDAHAEERGWLFLYEDEEMFRRAAADRETRRANGVVLEELSEADVRALEPGLPAIFKRGTMFPKEYHTADVRRFVAAIGEGALRDGATLQQRAVDSVSRLADGRFSLKAGGESFVTDLVVVAAGPHSARFAEELGSPVPHCAERGYGVTFPHAAVKLNRPVTFTKQKAVAAPMAAGLHLISTGEFAPLETRPDHRQTDNLHALGEAMFPGFDDREMARWSGWRSTVPDGLPVIGEAPNCPNLFLAFGHSHLGLTLAGLSASLIAAMATGRKPVMDPAPFRVDRFRLVPQA